MLPRPSDKVSVMEGGNGRIKAVRFEPSAKECFCVSVASIRLVASRSSKYGQSWARQSSLENTEEICLLSGSTANCPSLVSQRWIVPSSEPEALCFPPAEKATRLTFLYAIYTPWKFHHLWCLIRSFSLAIGAKFNEPLVYMENTAEVIWSLHSDFEAGSSLIGYHKQLLLLCDLDAIKLPLGNPLTNRPILVFRMYFFVLCPILNLIS